MKLFSSRSVHYLAVFAWCCGELITARAATAENASPDVSISLRGLVNGAVEAGESFRVAVRIDAPESATAKLILAPAKGSWIDATTVEILSTDGKPVPAAARAVVAVTAESSTTIDTDNPANGLWWFPAETLGRVTVGDYLVRARLTIRDGTGWKGEAVSEPASLRVVAGSAEPERVLQRKLERARAAILAGEPAKGAEILNAILEADSDCIPALALHAALSLEGGNRTAASVCIHRALMLATKPGEEPSTELNELAIRIEGWKPEGAAVATEVPIWTRIPRSVFEPVRTEKATVPGLSVPEQTNPRPAQVPVPVVATPPAPTKPVAVPVSPATAPEPVAQVSSAKSVGVLIAAAELSDAKIIADPAGQWAASAAAGSQYGRTQYSATQATGAPNVKVQGNSADAWCPANKNTGIDWLEVTFAQPVHAVEVRARQNDAAGAIVKIEAFESNGTVHLWWEGADSYQASAVREIVWFGVRVPKTSYEVSRVKVTLNLATGPGYKEIDAVQLVAAP